ncbi:hypothetical protein GPECTOR_106g119 [Gonium pectorale]|uniref:Uncharacterized protein n=1 Tax=Gonium pectorale TaxID=33097 RepID=A0A150G0Q5_GONPE|nr:hypothetical protein GPECTOR_106g119 [Gonium pectorale]|eukprot:KXZ43025.1 hypothetical protein GPECTOR_106g119 [Gonium pectorale]
METNDAALHFQILDLGRQYYVWVSAVGPKLGSLHLAIKTPAAVAERRLLQEFKAMAQEQEGDAAVEAAAGGEPPQRTAVVAS